MGTVEILQENQSLIKDFNYQISSIERFKKTIFLKDILKRQNRRINRKKVFVDYLKDQRNEAIAELIKSEKY